MELTNEQLVEMYRRMVRIRRFEENVVDMVASGEIPGAVSHEHRPGRRNCRGVHGLAPR